MKEALQNLVSSYAVDIEIENTDNIEDLIKAIIKANNNLTDSTSNGDLEMVGKDIKRLQDLIDKLEELKEEKEDEKNQNKKQDTNMINTINNQLDENIIE